MLQCMIDSDKVASLPCIVQSLAKGLAALSRVSGPAVTVLRHSPRRSKSPDRAGEPVRGATGGRVSAASARTRPHQLAQLCKLGVPIQLSLSEHCRGLPCISASAIAAHQPAASLCLKAPEYLCLVTMTRISVVKLSSCLLAS